MLSVIPTYQCITVLTIAWDFKIGHCLRAARHGMYITAVGRVRHRMQCHGNTRSDCHGRNNNRAPHRETRTRGTRHDTPKVGWHGTGGAGEEETFCGVGDNHELIQAVGKHVVGCNSRPWTMDCNMCATLAAYPTRAFYAQLGLDVGFMDIIALSNHLYPAWGVGCWAWPCPPDPSWLFTTTGVLSNC